MPPESPLTRLLDPQIVSRETILKLETYGALLEKWQRAVNLVSGATLGDKWRRHFLDSAQLFPLLPDPATPLADIGSGAGFPGLVLAVMGASNVHLIEADQKKAAFLREVARATGTPVSVHAERAETVTLPDVRVVTARALAPLADLLAHQHRLGAPLGLYLKGARAQEEIEAARTDWHFDVTSLPSQTDRSARILRVENVSRETIQS